MERFELQRRVDGLFYRFDRDGAVYRRQDNPNMRIAWDAAFGWCARDPQTGALTGRAWDMAPADQGDAPPAGRWVSSKEERAYVCDLVWL